MNIKQYLEKKGFGIQIMGENYMLNCPFCGEDRNRMGINIRTGSWNCFNCDRRGRKFHTFQKTLKDEKVQDVTLEEQEEKKKVKIDQTLAHKHHDLLTKSKRLAENYLKAERGFSKKTIDYFQLGSKKFKGYEYISIPFWEKGKLVNIKFRALIYKEKRFKWRRIAGGDSCLFHDEIIDDKDYKDVYITEAEFDAISLYNAGLKNVISVTTGAKAFKQEWYNRLERYKRIYIVFDNDEDGQAGAFKMARRLGLNRCLNIRLPEEVKDVNEFFWNSKKEKVKNNLKDFKLLVKDARKFEALDCISAKDALKDLYKSVKNGDEDELYGFDTPWEKVNKLTKAIRPGYLVLIGSPPKIGKTSFALDWAEYLAKTNVRTLMYECEMRPKRLGEKLVRMHSPEFALTDFIKPDHISSTYFNISENLYFGHPQLNNAHYKTTEDAEKFDLNVDVILERIKDAVQTYGIECVIFDHLHFLVRSENVSTEIGLITRKFKMLAESLDIVVVLIVQPKKIGTRMMTINDFKDSASIFQDCDVSLILHRETNADAEDLDGMDKGDSEGHFFPVTVVSVAGRFTEGGKTVLTFDGARSLFYEEGSIHTDELAAHKQRKKLRGVKRGKN